MIVDQYELLAQSFETRPDYRYCPHTWVAERAKGFLWSLQERIALALVEHRFVAVPSCHGVGKTYLASLLAAWWIDTFGTDPTEVFLVTTAPTASQVAVVLWRYIGQVHRNNKLTGKINRSPYPQWVIGPDTVGIGRKPADYEESAFQGIHAKHMLIIVDEACGVLPNLWDQLFSLASNLNGRILAIGNPTDPATFFYQACQPTSDWHVIQVDGLRTPNMSEEATEDYPLTRALMQAEGIPFSTEQIPDSVAEDILSPLYVEERIRAYCGFTKTDHLSEVNGQPKTGIELAELKDDLRRRTANSPMFQARVRGVFPTNISTGVIPLGWIEQAMARWHDWNDAGRPEMPGRRVIGVDVARYGDDDTCLAIRQGSVVQDLIVRSKQDTVATTNDVVPYLNWPQALAVVDVNGIGAGVYDQLRHQHETGIGGQVMGVPIPFNASAKTDRRDMIGEHKFRTDRDASWWRMRELLDPSKGSLVALPDDEMLKVELSSVQYKVLTGAIVVVESKDEIKKRIGRSPDRADAVIQSWWVEGLPVDWDPSDAVVLDTHDGTFGYVGYASARTEDDLFANVAGTGWGVYGQ